jgi:antitoxin (DNA-binding transcriptional repressor) of toxin-antitoxin stability system
MRTVTATRASRGFSDLLDAVEHGETVQVTRAGHVVAEIRLDDTFASDINAATSLLTADESDPWHAG